MKFLISLPKNIRSKLLIAGGIYLFGAIGMEMISGFHVENYGRDIVYNIITTVEEIFEMVGILIFIYALLFYIRTHLNGIQIKL